jgi:hypothetical protein
MSLFARIIRPLYLGFLFVALCIAIPAAAQGNGKNKGRDTPPGQAKKQVSPNQAVVVMREVLVSHGFTVVRVEHVGATQVVYYRRGNNGKGKGKGPVEKIIVRPAGDVVVFESAPKGVLIDINVRLGL